MRVLLVLALLGPACAGSPALGTGTQAADNAAVARAFAEHRSPLEVTAQGHVERVLSDETSNTGTHQRFIVKMDGLTQTLLITNNVSIGTRVPVGVGDAVVVHGEYIWSDQGGLIHFTHHDPDGAHPSGWIERNGVRYQ